jgi:hypothetical protein
MSVLLTGYPIVVSLPHFYLADDEYLDGVVGLNPTQEKHEITLLFEPVCGQVMSHCGWLSVLCSCMFMLQFHVLHFST